MYGTKKVFQRTVTTKSKKHEKIRDCEFMVNATWTAYLRCDCGREHPQNRIRRWGGKYKDMIITLDDATVAMKALENSNKEK